MLTYRAEIRADLLREYGVDLGVWWRARRWRALLELIDMLPDSSRLAEARYSDPTEAARILDARRAAKATDGASVDGEWAPPMHQYDLTAHLLREIRNLLGGFVTGNKLPPMPYPHTALEDEKARRAERDALVTIAQATPEFAYLLEEYDAQHEPPRG